MQVSEKNRIAIFFGVLAFLLIAASGMIAHAQQPGSQPQQPQISCVSELGNIYLQAKGLLGENNELKAENRDLRAQLLKLQSPKPEEKK